jgi:hypothetical protein
MDLGGWELVGGMKMSKGGAKEVQGKEEESEGLGKDGEEGRAGQGRTGRGKKEREEGEMLTWPIL